MSPLMQVLVCSSVSISVVTIKGTDCKLVELGKLADKTGGQVSAFKILTIKVFETLKHHQYLDHGLVPPRRKPERPLSAQITSHKLQYFLSNICSFAAISVHGFNIVRFEGEGGK